MNPRQRRGLIFILLGLMVAAVSFYAVTSYVGDIQSQVGPMATVYRAKRSIDPYQPLSEDNVEPYEVPQRWAAGTSVLSLDDIRGRRVEFRLEKGSVISSDMLLASTGLEANQREIAINVDAVTGIAGRVRPGDRVDMYAVFQERRETGQAAGVVRVLVRDVRVVTIAGKQTVTTSGEGGNRSTDVIPVTLALSPDDALAVTYAYNFAREVRLVGLPTDQGVRRDPGELGHYSGEDVKDAKMPAASTPSTAPGPHASQPPGTSERPAPTASPTKGATP